MLCCFCFNWSTISLYHHIATVCSKSCCPISSVQIYIYFDLFVHYFPLLIQIVQRLLELNQFIILLLNIMFWHLDVLRLIIELLFEYFQFLLEVLLNHYFVIFLAKRLVLVLNIMWIEHLVTNQLVFDLSLNNIRVRLHLFIDFSWWNSPYINLLIIHHFLHHLLFLLLVLLDP